MAAEWAVKIRDAADALAPQLREWREALHRHPELKQFLYNILMICLCQLVSIINHCFWPDDII